MDVALLYAAEDGPNPIIPAWGEVVVGLIAFGLLFLFLSKTVFPMFEKAYAERKNAIEGGMERAEQAQAEAKAALENYQAQLADARGEAAQIRDTARAEGQRIVEELREQAQQESARIVARGEQQLTAQRNELVVQMRSELGQLSIELASRIVGESLSDEARRAGTVDRFIDELDRESETSEHPEHSEQGAT